jgi:hypothetical protein
VVQAAGTREASCAPVLDATLQGPDAVFALRRPYLPRLAIPPADQGLLLADGAPWLWKRGPRLVQALGWPAERVHALLDFYPAVPRLGQVAALRKDWSATARARWRTPQRHLLLQGQGEQGIAAVRVICRGRNSTAMRTHRDYCSRHQSRMVSAKLMDMKLPLGSGAIESTVRRVVNLRLKGPRLCWCRASAEAILLLRSYYKVGRWNLLKHMATSHRALLEA